MYSDSVLTSTGENWALFQNVACSKILVAGEWGFASLAAAIQFWKKRAIGCQPLTYVCTVKKRANAQVCYMYRFSNQFRPLFSHSLFDNPDMCDRSDPCAKIELNILVPLSSAHTPCARL